MHSPDPSWFAIVLMSLSVASVHLWYPWFEERYKAYETRWVGFTGGIATGYVTLYLLPKLGTIATYLTADQTGWAFLSLKAYLLLLAGIVLYLTMEWIDRDVHSPWLAKIFDHSIHGAYSFLVGYVLVELSTRGPVALILITFILAVHLIGMNHILRHLRQANYDRFRWLYFLIVLTGSTLAAVTELPPTVIKLLTALLAGMIIVNAMSDEMPRGHQGRLRWYLLGVVFFIGAMILITKTAPPVITAG